MSDHNVEERNIYYTSSTRSGTAGALRTELARHTFASGAVAGVTEALIRAHCHLRRLRYGGSSTTEPACTTVICFKLCEL